MSTTTLPPTLRPDGGDRSPVRVAGVVITALAGCLLLGVAGSTFIGAVAVVLVAGAGVAAVYLFNNPTAVLPLCVYSMWFEGVGAGQVLTAGRLTVIVALGVIVVLALTSPWRPAAPLPRGWVAIAVFMVWAWVAGFWSDSLGAFFTTYLQLFLGFGYFVVFFCFTESYAQIWALLKRWVWLGLPITIVGTFLYFTLGDKQRVSGFTGGPNNYSAYLTAGFPLIVLMLREARGRRRAVIALLIPCYVAGIVTSGSRAGLIGAAVVGVYCLTTIPGLPWRRRVAVALLGALGMGVVGFGAMTLNPERFSPAVLFGQSDEGAGRLSIWNAGVQTFEQNWLKGMGFGQFRQFSVEIIQNSSGGDLEVTKQQTVLQDGVLDTHNQFLQLGLDLGVIGVVLYGVMVAACLWNLFQKAKSEWRDLIWAFTGILLAIHVMFMFSTQLNQKFMWSIFGIAASFYVRQRLTARADRVRFHAGFAPTGGARVDP